MLRARKISTDRSRSGLGSKNTTLGLLFQRGQCFERMGDHARSLVEYEMLIQRAQRVYELLVIKQQPENVPWDLQIDAFADILTRAQDDAAND